MSHARRIKALFSPTRMSMLMAGEWTVDNFKPIFRKGLPRFDLSQGEIADAYAHIERHAARVDRIFLPRMYLHRVVDVVSGNHLWGAEVIHVDGMDEYVILESDDAKMRVVLELRQ